MKKIIYEIEKLRLRRFPRYKYLESKILGFPITLIDKSSFIFMYDEIFNKEIYKFKSKTNNPIIIDCGANIGLSVLYFKKIYPEAKIIAFEPDKKIFNILQENIASSRIKNVELINKGLSQNDCEVSFFSEGADGGRIALESDNPSNVKAQMIKLSPFIKNKIDFLKIDIEGSELCVLEECKDFLKNIDNIFVEYHSLVSKRQELDKILQILTNAGFRYYIEKAGVVSEHPFININSHFNYDLQLNISAKKI